MEWPVSDHHTRQLTAYRRAHGLTQEDLAELLNVSAATISRWESLAQSPDPEHIVMIENLLGLQRLNSCEEWRFRVARSLGYEVLFDENGIVAAAAAANLALAGIDPDCRDGLRMRDLLPANAASEAASEYARLGYHAHRQKLFLRQMRLIKYTAELRTPTFSSQIVTDFWPIVTSQDETFVLMSFVATGPISDPDWPGAFRVLTYQTHSISETSAF